MRVSCERVSFFHFPLDLKSFCLIVLHCIKLYCVTLHHIISVFINYTELQCFIPFYANRVLLSCVVLQSSMFCFPYDISLVLWCNDFQCIKLNFIVLYSIISLL